MSDRAVLGTAWNVKSSRQMDNNTESTHKNGNYQSQGHFSYIGNVPYDLYHPNPTNVDRQYYLDQARAQMATILQKIRTDFIAKMNNGVTVQSLVLDYDISLVSAFGTAPVQFYMSGQKTLQFTDISDPIPILVIVGILILIAVILALAAVIMYEVTVFVNSWGGMIFTVGAIAIGGLLIYALFFTDQGRKATSKAYSLGRRGYRKLRSM